MLKSLKVAVAAAVITLSGCAGLQRKPAEPAPIAVDPYKVWTIEVLRAIHNDLVNLNTKIDALAPKAKEKK